MVMVLTLDEAPKFDEATRQFVEKALRDAALPKRPDPSRIRWGAKPLRVTVENTTG